jgi:mannose-6-phosphate isomerase class I
MKICLKTQTNEVRNSDQCIVTEYPIQDTEINFAIAKVTGRYPDSGYVTNQLSKEMAYVSEGEGKLIVNGQEYLISAGGLAFIETGEIYAWEGNMTLFISCRPAFTIEQHKRVA